jgi:hypothetical protein
VGFDGPPFVGYRAASIVQTLRNKSHALCPSSDTCYWSHAH